MKNWAQGTVHPTEDVTLRYFRSGGEKPPLVLVHGFTDNALYFEELADLLAETWDVVAYDARGHGESSRITDRFDDDLRADDLQFVVNTLALDRPALLGHSMGAATIALAAARNPRLTRGVVLEDPAWWEPNEPSSPEAATIQRNERITRNQAWRAWVAAVQTMPLKQALAERASESPKWSVENVERSTAARLQVQLELFDHFPPERSPWRSIVDQLLCPTLIVIGDHALGGIITAELASEMCSRNDRIEIAAIAEAGHAIRYDRFDAFSAATVDFLNRVSA